MDKTLLNKKYRLFNLYKIIDKNQKSIVFSPNAAQQIVRNKERELQEKYGKVRLLVLKARQEWITTYKIIDGLDETLFKPNQTRIITAHREDKQKEMFQKAKYAYEQLPTEIPDIQRNDWIRTKPIPKYDNANELFFPDINSKIKVTLGSRSTTPSWLHVTELAFREDWEAMMTGTLPSLPAHSPCTIETTANWVSGYFYQLWKKFYNNPDPNPERHCLFLPWYIQPEYRSSILREVPQEISHINLLPIDQEQKNWYVEQYWSLGRMVFQEYPSTPEEAFLSTWSSFFNIPIVKNIPKVKYEDDLVYPDLRRYRRTTEPVIIWVDTSEWWSTWDYAGIKVRSRDLRLIACYMWRIPPDALCEIIDYIWNRVGRMAVIGIERNNTWLVTLNNAQKYPWFWQLYSEKTFDQNIQKTTKKIGWITTSKTRPLLLQDYEELVRTWWIYEIDERLRNQMYDFVYNEKKKPEAIEWSHDDLVMTDAICCWMRKEPMMVNYSADIISPTGYNMDY